MFYSRCYLMLGFMFLLSPLSAQEIDENTQEPTNPESSTVVVMDGQDLKLLIGETKRIKFKHKVPRILIQKPLVVDWVALSPDEFKVTANSVGLSSITVHNEKNEVTSFSTSVEANIPKLQGEILARFPKSQIKVESWVAGVFLTGEVLATEELVDVKRMAETQGLVMDQTFPYSPIGLKWETVLLPQSQLGNIIEKKGQTSLGNRLPELQFEGVATAKMLSNLSELKARQSTRTLAQGKISWMPTTKSDSNVFELMGFGGDQSCLFDKNGSCEFKVDDRSAKIQIAAIRNANRLSAILKLDISNMGEDWDRGIRFAEMNRMTVGETRMVAIDLKKENEQAEQSLFVLLTPYQKQLDQE